MNETTVLTRAQVREVDRRAIEMYGLPGVVLMENAGRSVAEAVREAARPPGRVVLLCGGGNNGGDGYVAARHLSNAGYPVVIYATRAPEALSGDAAVHAAVAARMGIVPAVVSSPQDASRAAYGWRDAAVIVDALLGTGFSGDVRSPLAELIEACNGVRDATVLAVDVPSGLDCDTGRPGRPTVRADVTVTFVAPKAGFRELEAKPYLGKVVVGDIGVPKGLVDAVAGG